jgi:hypothetical protein
VAEVVAEEAVAAEVVAEGIVLQAVPAAGAIPEVEAITVAEVIQAAAETEAVVMPIAIGPEEVSTMPIGAIAVRHTIQAGAIVAVVHIAHREETPPAELLEAHIVRAEETLLARQQPEPRSLLEVRSPDQAETSPRDPKDQIDRKGPTGPIDRIGLVRKRGRRNARRDRMGDRMGDRKNVMRGEIKFRTA